MRALCVDDEPILLRALSKAVESSSDIDEIKSFSNGKDALEYAAGNKIDIAFLDIQIHKMNGIELAQELRKIYPKLPVIFCTGYNEYALEAFKIHANGYLTKPIRAADVREQIDNIKEMLGIGETKKLKVTCFGNFEVTYDGKPLNFKRAKAKEIFAYLIDRKGSVVPSGQIVTELWDDTKNEKSIKNSFYQALHDLKSTLNEVNMEKVLVKELNGFGLDKTLIDCDYYNYLDGEASSDDIRIDEYMYQYSWAENTLGNILNNI